jgi:hypothetical protein
MRNTRMSCAAFSTTLWLGACTTDAHHSADEVDAALHVDALSTSDVLGWRRERAPARPTGTPVSLRPDWVCEVVSSSNANDDTVKKLRLYRRVAVPHYWLVDPRDALSGGNHLDAHRALTELRHLNRKPSRPGGAL